MPGRPFLSTALVLLCIAWPAHAQRAAVDLELAFVVDASGSIDEAETRLQRRGYADALANPRVLGAIGSGFLRAVAVAYIEFAGPGCERVSVGWTRVSDSASARTFGGKILALPPMFCPGGNAIGDAVALATASIAGNGFEGTRLVIDVSGDGPNTIGLPVEFARDSAVAAGITVNGLVIERPSMPDLDEYYRAAVTGGPRSFVIKADDRRSFADAILKKMILEIAGRGGRAPGTGRLRAGACPSCVPRYGTVAPTRDEGNPYSLTLSRRDSAVSKGVPRLRTGSRLARGMPNLR